MDNVTRKLRELKETNPAAFAEAVLKLSPDEAQSILYNWEIWGRDRQLPPEGKWRFWVVSGGRGGGKSRTISEWVIERARQGKGPIALIGATSADVRDTLIEVGPSSILNVAPPDFMPHYEPSKRRLVFPNGVMATLFSAEEPQQLRGPQHMTAVLDEIVKYPDDMEVFRQMNLGLRVGTDSRCAIATTPAPTKLIKKLYSDWKKDPEGTTRFVIIPTLDNAANLDPNYLHDLEEQYKGTSLYRQEVLGELILEAEMAQFRWKDIEDNRVREEQKPEMRRIVVGVDPAVTSNKNSDCTGIVVVGLGFDEQFYCLADYSIKGTPSEWAMKIAEAYEYWEADCVVAETNNGGDLVVMTLQMFSKNLPVKKIHASRGKLTRSEPISLLMQQGKIHHVGEFSELEQQLTSYDGRGSSPDRLDAYVHGLSELAFQKKQGKVTISDFFM